MAVQEVNLEMVDLLRPYFLSKPQAGEVIIIPGEIQLDPLYVDNIYEKTADHGVNIDGALAKDGGLTADPLYVDTINEKTAAHGVIVDGVLIKDTTIDVNGAADAVILDADGDTTISAPTDDQIDIEIASADDFRFTANTFTALSGSTIKTDTIAETTAAAGVTIDGLLIKDGDVDFNGIGEIIFDADADTSMRGVGDDRIDIQVGGISGKQYIFDATAFKTDYILNYTDGEGVDVHGVIMETGNIYLGETGDQIYLDSDFDTHIKAGADDQIDFQTGGTVRMNLTDSGLTMSTGARVNEFSTDGTLAGNSDTAAPTEKAVKTYVDLRSAVGEIRMWVTDTAPAGWLLCYGQAVSRTTYSALYAVIATTFGAGDGSTTFNLPDFRGRVPLGQDDMGGTGANRVTAAAADSIGGSGGAETHTLTVAEMPAHNHQNIVGWTAGSNPYPLWDGASNDAAFGLPTTTADTGGDDPHNNVQPYLTINFIIFAAA